MLFYFACEAAGASAPGIPHALLRNGGKFLHTSDAFAPRERRGVTDLLRRRCDKRKPFAHASAGECHSPCHRPRRRAIQYCRGADNQWTGRGVLDTRFRGYNGGAYYKRFAFAHGSAANSFCFASRLIASLRSQWRQKQFAWTPLTVPSSPRTRGPITTGVV